MQYAIQSFSLLIITLSLALGLTIVAGIPKAWPGPLELRAGDVFELHQDVELAKER